MKNKIKKFAASVAVMMMALPVLVSAAGFSVPGGTNLPTGSITGIITNIMNWLLMLVGIIGVIGFAIAGILYLTAAGDDTAIERAKSAMLYSIIGVIVAIIGVVVIQAVQGMLGGTSTTY
jgi:cytochrome bd-type quinol oxidase subunit 2